MLMDHSNARAGKMDKHRARVRPRIEVSALAAVVWTLAIAMMFATEYHHPGVTANLPLAQHVTDEPGALREDALRLMITCDGKTFFGTELLANSEQLPDRVRLARMQTVQKKIYIKADARVRYGAVRRALVGLQTAGVEDIAFLAEQPMITR